MQVCVSRLGPGDLTFDMALNAWRLFLIETMDFVPTIASSGYADRAKLPGAFHLNEVLVSSQTTTFQ
jgi:hypothetical protein